MKRISILITFTTLIVAHAHAQKTPTPPSAPLIRSNYGTGEITKLCDAEIAKNKAILDQIAKIPKAERTFENTLLRFEISQADLSDSTTPLAFMGSVSTNKDMSKEASACKEKLGQFEVESITRRDLYNALLGQTGHSADEKRLHDKTIEGFEHNGLKLSDEKLAQVKALLGELTTRETKFSTNLNQDNSTVALTAEELEGVPADALSRFTKAADGKLVATTKDTDLLAVMENAKNAGARKKMMHAYQNRAYPANIKLLQETLGLRAKVAHLLGYKTWADYKIELRMAKNQKSVFTFLDGLRAKLAKRNASDMAQLLKFKKETLPEAQVLNAWDTVYYQNQMKKRDYSVDDEKIRAYFPADVVIGGLFSAYSQMLGVQYVEVPGAEVWAEGVKLYEIRDKSDGRLLAHFFTDLAPRPGKYGHAAAFPLIVGRRLADGSYSQPISCIVANLTPPSNSKPSLLTHSEVRTLFHEFGHIMHQTLTQAPYASLAGSSVARDFVEAPSQMLENWVWDSKTLSLLSGLYSDHSQKLPPDLLQKMIAARDFNQGLFYTRQLLYGLYDLTLHIGNGEADATNTFNDLYRKIVGIEPIEGGHFAASFGHLMGGYDAGYYGYLWSEVYAQDMFSKFPADDLTGAKTGHRYRTAILERGNMRDPIVLLRDFLGREPNNKAFFKKLHIQ